MPLRKPPKTKAEGGIQSGNSLTRMGIHTININFWKEDEVVFFKKLLSVICSVVLITVAGAMTVSAGYDDGGKIIINNENYPAFSELVSVIDGKMYVPLRLIFPNLNDRENKIGMTISWNGSDTIHLIYGFTTGEAMENGAAPYTGVRYNVDISIAGDPSEGAYARFTVVQYTLDENGSPVRSEPEIKDMNDPIYLKPVEGGGRFFVSIDDIKDITEYLGIENDYSVKLMTEVFENA